MAPKEFMLDLDEENIDAGNGSEISLGDDVAPMDEDFALQGYDDDIGNSSPMALEGYADYIGANDADEGYIPDQGVLDHEDENDIAAPSAKRAKSTQPAHFHQSTHAAERSAKRVIVNESANYHIDDDAGIAYTTPTRKPGTFGKFHKEKGSTLPAYHKKVSWELDSDDELIMAMRNKGFSDKQIAARLQKDGRIKYDPKSVATRVQRIRVVQAQRGDFELENGIKEWKFEDDLLLLRAYDLASIEIAYEIERLRAWRYKKTAEWMRRLNKDVNFSGKACHARYASLLDGTATIPSDLDADPAARHAEMAALRQQREDAREAEREAQEAREADLQRIKDEAAARQAQVNMEKAEKRMKASQDAGARATLRATKKNLQQQQAEEHLRKKQRTATEKLAKQAAGEATRKFREDFALRHFKHVNDSTPDPRRVLDVGDLRMLCRARKINDYTLNKGREAKCVLLERLRDADDALSARQLADLVKARNIPAGGNKTQMKYQLALCAARSCDSFMGEKQGGEGEMEVDG